MDEIDKMFFSLLSSFSFFFRDTSVLVLVLCCAIYNIYGDEIYEGTKEGTDRRTNEGIPS